MRSILSVAPLVATLLGIYLTSFHGYLLFHGLAEVFSIVIACGIFMVAWNARRLLRNHYLLFIGIAYLYVGGIDILHTLSYKGMGVFEGEGANLPTQLWIAARYVEALSLLLATIFLHRRLSPRFTLAGYTLSTGVLLVSIFWWKVFPNCFIEGVGLTPFKIYSEYVICLIFLAAIGLLIRNAEVFERHVLILLIASIAAAVAGELAFTTYLSVYGPANMIGHLLKVVSFYLIYKAIVETSLVAPWNLLFRDLKQSEEALRELNATLESRVAKRTEELEHRAWQLQKLALELSQTEDRERRRLAEILHDDLQQQIAAAKFHVGLIASRVKGDPSLHKATAKVDEMLMEAIAKSRSLSHELCPAILQHGTLAEALGWLANQMQMKHGLVVRVDATGQVDSHSDALKSFLYRAVQELLFNVVKHARAGEARVRVRRLGRCLGLSVSDRGRGFDPQTLKVAKGFGLFSIRERVELMGGRMRIRSAEDQGSTFLITIADDRMTEGGDQRAQVKGRRTGAGLAPSAVPGPSSSGHRLRVLLVDDHEIVRQGLAALFAEVSDIEVVGEAADGREAIDQACRLRPDVIVMDVAMPLMNGDEAARQIKRHLPATRIIALSMFQETEAAERMQRAGAERYVLKTAPSEELLAAVRGAFGIDGRGPVP